MVSISRLARKVWNRLRPKSAWERSWYKTLRSFDVDIYDEMLDFDLGESSVAIDVGGHTGDFTRDLFVRSACRVHVIEPIPAFARKLRHRFRRNPRIAVYEHALGDRDHSETLYIDDAATSSFKRSGSPVAVRFLEVGQWLRDNGIEQIDLLASNCEGGEYELLPRLIELGVLPRVDNILVQFHRYSPDDERRRTEIVTEIEKTHRPIVSYPFVWERWERRG